MNSLTGTKALYYCLVSAFAAVSAFGVIQASKNITNTQPNRTKTEYRYIENSSSESSSESTTLALFRDAASVMTTEFLPDCYFNTDGKLHGTKGKFSGLWPQLEGLARRSNEKYIKDLMVYVGDNTELSKCSYENDNFKKINGYGTVHWAQWGHKWPNRYSAAVSGYSYQSAEPTTETTTKRKFSILQTADNTQSKYLAGTDEEFIAAEEEVNRAAPQILPLPDLSVLHKSGEAEDEVDSDTAIEKENIDVESFTYTPRFSSGQSFGGSGGTWGSSACGVCSLAMALSTLSGRTVSPPECAIAANLLIGRGAWSGLVLFSASQARLARLAGFYVETEPFTSAKKSTMDRCLDSNGVALFATSGSAWASGGGRHYIMVRNRVGDKYYTADSGKNPVTAFTYEEISAGYNQQMIVYIYPKNYKKK